MDGLKERFLNGQRSLPLVIQPVSRTALHEQVRRHSLVLQQKLIEHGALLFREFGTGSVGEFDAFIDAVSSHRMEYMYRSTPRTSLGRHILTASEYPCEQTIPLHNENSYQRSWPLRISFCCIEAAARGGETSIANMAAVTAMIDPAILDRFATRGVKYVRHYYPHVDISWQVTFQTDSRNELGRICETKGIEYAWVAENILRTSSIAQGVARHPITGALLFFNQAHLFHASSLGEQSQLQLVEVFGKDRLPRHACYGDGTEFSMQELECIRRAFQSAQIDLGWKPGDILLLDNMQVAHGRLPFTGRRRVMAALLDPYSPPSG